MPPGEIVTVSPRLRSIIPAAVRRLSSARDASGGLTRVSTAENGKDKFPEKSEKPLISDLFFLS